MHRLPGPPDAGAPLDLDAVGLAIALVSLGVAFAALTLIPLRVFPWNLVPALLFTAIPILALWATAGPRWQRLFGPVGWKEVGLMVGFAMLTLIASVIAGLLLQRFVSLTGNPVANAMETMSVTDLALTLLPTLPQLLGEELFGVLPFLAAYWLCVDRLGLRQSAGLVIGVAVSALVFGAAHLPTYGWNVPQALVVIGTARVVLTLAYVATRNLWVSTGAHVLNDWTLFVSAYGLGHLPIGTELPEVL